jgi:Protein of unknown function (DUF3467)
MYGRRKTDHGGLVEKFSNSFSIGFNGYLFIFDFAMVNSTGSGHIHSRIVTSPADAAEFSQLLAESLGQHEQVKKELEPVDPDCKQPVQ